MISGTHVIVYSKDAGADRAFFRNVLGLPSIDAGHGWLIFALPPAEAAFHPSDTQGAHELYFMCDDLKAELVVLQKKDVHFSEVSGNTTGFRYQDAASRWKRGRPVSTKASDCVRLEMKRRTIPFTQ
jgi:hypothetical protein